MGCGISSKPIIQEKILDPPSLHQNDYNYDEDEVQIIKEAKPSIKSEFDEIIIKLPPEKMSDDSNEKIKQGQPVNIIKIDETVSDAKRKNHSYKITINDLQLDKASKTIGSTVFENYPHIFDFSFLDKRHKMKTEKDLATEQILKEILEILEM